MSRIYNIFSREFYPTPAHIIEKMLQGIDLSGKIVLEPSAGKGDIVKAVKARGAAQVLACENDPNLRKILKDSCKLIAEDFLTVQSETVSHIDYIIMNPPFSDDVEHITHAYTIAPPGCHIIALCALSRLENQYSRSRKEFASIIDSSGCYEDIGDCFTEAERNTDAQIALIRLVKPGGSESQEFAGFFLEEDIEQQENGIISYNFIRDIVNRYVGAVKVYDEYLKSAVKMNSLLYGFYGNTITFTCTEAGTPKARQDFKKDLQMAAWKFVFEKMNMDKYVTKSVKEDLNKFVEKQQQFPFTMRNIYHMIEVIIGTHSGNMDKALLEIFDKLTKHYDENRYNLPGWKTNSHYLVNRKFIIPYLSSITHGGYMGVTYYSDRYQVIDDFQKALCFLTGKNYDDIGSIWTYFQRTDPEDANVSEYKKRYMQYRFNTWYEFGFFEFKGFKKGTFHFKFKEEAVWELFNRRIAKLKGYPLPEFVKKEPQPQPESRPTWKEEEEEELQPIPEDIFQQEIF